jgi:hypothetical protein
MPTKAPRRPGPGVDEQTIEAPAAFPRRSSAELSKFQSSASVRIIDKGAEQEEHHADSRQDQNRREEEARGKIGT